MLAAVTLSENTRSEKVANLVGGSVGIAGMAGCALGIIGAFTGIFTNNRELSVYGAEVLIPSAGALFIGEKDEKPSPHQSHHEKPGRDVMKVGIEI